MKYLIYIFLSIFFSIQSAFSLQRTVDDYNLERTEFFLMTVGVGEGVEQRYGHTVLMIADYSTGFTHHLNWGTFDFAQPNFYVNFLMGKLRYWLTDYSYAVTVGSYGAQNRAVLAEKIHLSSFQKRHLLERVLLNLQSENRYFWYDFFFKNCSTIPRDLLDSALHGTVRERFEQVKASKSFRQYVRDHLNIPIVVAWVFDVWGNELMDQPITAWEEMFYPIKLREYLREMPQVDDQGRVILNTSLLGSTIPLIEGNLNLVSRSSTSSYGVYILVIGVQLLLLFLSFSGSVSLAQPSSRGRRIFHRLVYLNSAFFSLTSGCLGLVMALAWGVSEHTLMHNNLNLWLFWPIDFVFFVMCALRVFSLKRNRHSDKIDILLWCWSSLHILCFVTLSVLSALSLVEQDLSYVLVFGGGPYYLSSLLLMTLIGLMSSKPNEVKEKRYSETVGYTS